MIVLPQTKSLLYLMSTIRNKDTSRERFVLSSDRVIRLLLEEALALLPYRETTIQTPTGSIIDAYEPEGRICGVSIMRAGESMEKGLRECCEAVRYFLHNI